MRVLRSTLYGQAPHEVATMVQREVDVSSWVEAVAQAQAPRGGVLIIVETFSMPGDPSLVVASVEAERRRRENEDRERNMAILYHYDGMVLARVTPNVGVLTPTIRAPLTADEIRIVFKQLTQHPNYRNQHVIAFSADGTTVEIRNGRVSGGPAMNGH